MTRQWLLALIVVAVVALLVGGIGGVIVGRAYVIQTTPAPSSQVELIP